MPSLQSEPSKRRSQLVSHGHHLDLFSGIGGFAIAAQWAGFKTIAFSEIDPFCGRLLGERFPGIPNLGDIADIDGREYKGLGLITGGFPCQPYSVSGRREGSEDDRALWPQMARVIQEARPRWVLGENVVGLATMGLDEVLDDLGNLHYSTEAVIIPSCAVDAPHKRERIWIIASDSESGNRDEHETDRGHGQAQREEVFGNRACVPHRRERWQDMPSVCRVDDGVSSGLDDDERRKALGNAIVPQLAFEIINKMTKIDNEDRMRL